ncbi:hypothetical protein IMSAG025_00287 [Muribaculaceae bacterium]|nr:hypothetical protein IMSAG025_00287 [Muribaculaceae bacterium]
MSKFDKESDTVTRFNLKESIKMSLTDMSFFNSLRMFMPPCSFPVEARKSAFRGMSERNSDGMP